jgi:hypothetical protein
MSISGEPSKKRVPVEKDWQWKWDECRPIRMRESHHKCLMYLLFESMQLSWGVPSRHLEHFLYDSAPTDEISMCSGTHNENFIRMRKGGDRRKADKGAPKEQKHV